MNKKVLFALSSLAIVVSYSYGHAALRKLGFAAPAVSDVASNVPSPEVGAIALDTQSGSFQGYVDGTTGWVPLSGSSHALSMVSISSASYTPTTQDMVLIDSSGGAVTIDLPSASSNTGKTYIFKKFSSDTNVVTLDPPSSDTIDGQTTFTISGQGETVQIVSNNTEWKVIQFLPTAIYGASGDTFPLSTSGYASGEYAQMSNNSITLPPGKWELSGIVVFTTGSATTTLLQGGYYESNGTNTTTAPTTLGTSVTYLSAPAATASMEMNGNIGSIVMPLPVVSISNSTTTTLYGVVRCLFSVAGTASLKVNITARRIP